MKCLDNCNETCKAVYVLTKLCINRISKNRKKYIRENISRNAKFGF